MSTTADTAIVSQPLTGAQRALVSREVVASADGRTDRASRIAWTAKLRAPVDRVRLRAAIEFVIASHPILSVRVVDRHRSMSLPKAGEERTVELIVTAEQPSRDTLARWVDRLDPDEGQHVLAVLSQGVDQPGYLSVLVHHVVFDGASAALFFNALSEAFAGGLGGSGGVVPEVGFVAYAEELAVRVGSGGFVDGVGFWGDALAGAPTVFGRVEDYGDRGEAVRVGVSLGELSGDVRELARREGVTLFMLLLAVFDVALFRLSGSRDVLVGSPMSTRSSRFRGAVGCFLNTVVLRSSVDEDVAFRELLRGVRRTVSEAIEHRDVPFELVLDALEVERSASHPPLVQAVLSAGDAWGDHLALTDVHVVPLDIMPSVGKSPIELTFHDGDQIELQVASDGTLLDGEAAES
ncbi:condensation domain-containing protein, partial [Qipengyuania citrea]|uniref:condensation domain-containing protein n=1 Tax=Qipengyuania citrea TaxID=225971 RepID=UPI003297BEF3